MCWKFKIFRIKIVWTVHNLERHEKEHHSLEKLFAPILARFSDIIIVHCETAKNEIKKAFRLAEDTKILTIPHGNYIGYYPDIVSQATARRLLKFSDSEVVFLFLGEVRHYKGVLELIDAFNLLDCEKAHLVIAGQAYNKEIAEEVLKKANDNRRIRVMLHLVPAQELQIYINASDVMVFPYRDILTSGSILLAMSFGKAIVAPMLGCIIDTLDYSGSILYDPCEQDGILKAMRRATDLNGQLLHMGKHNLELARRLTWPQIAKATYEAYKRCLE